VVADADSGGDPPATDELGHLRRLFEHGAWADRALLKGVRRIHGAEGEGPGETEADWPPGAVGRTGADGPAPAPTRRDAWREYAHVLAAQELWLARLEGRDASVPVWPELSPAGCEALQGEVAAGYETYLDDLTPSGLAADVRYVNSAGAEFTTPVGDILLHVALHGQYHRGKVNLLIRQAGEEPVPTDYIGFVRGAPAARTEVAR